ncbi:hypothetical protein Kisp02_45330 [Kineosporia sp. NBRC 101731]|nr:hypothetical protein Kisp02_45330 [Kineosporia sp. NBRC 101731]
MFTVDVRRGFHGFSDSLCHFFVARAAHIPNHAYDLLIRHPGEGPAGCIRSSQRLVWGMAGFLGKFSVFARSPQGKKLIQQVQTVAKDPATRAKVQAQAQQISKQLKDPATRAKVQEQARGLTKRLKDATGEKPKPGQSSPQTKPTKPASGPVYGTPPDDAPKYGQPPQH